MDALKNPNPQDGFELAEYIAVSVPLHVMDGFSFLGRAVDAALRCDSDTARHLAYYAELRAAMAILASEGIGVFNNAHFEVTSCSSIVQTGPVGGTHRAAWALFNEWAATSGAGQLIGDAIRFDGISLAAWFDGCFPVNSTQGLAAEWLRQWGIDLLQMQADRDSRNEASYRPAGLRAQMPALGPTVDAITSLWRMFEPEPTGRFNNMDAYLIRKGIEVDNTALPYHRPLEEVVDGVPGVTLQQREFILRIRATEDPKIIELSTGTSEISASTHHLEVIGRASLLLRVACGAGNRLLQAGGAGRSDLEFWWDSVGRARGLWDTTPMDFGDLWDDVQGHLDDLRMSATTHGNNLNALRQHEAIAIAKLGECEQIALWGFGF